MQSGDLDAAQTILEKLVAQKPDNDGARFNLGNVLFNKGQFARAADSYREAIRLRPDFARAHFNLALALQKLNNDDAAKLEFDEAQRLDPALVPEK